MKKRFPGFIFDPKCARSNNFRCPYEFTIVPVLVGSLSVQKEKQYGQFFSKYLNDPDNFFVISSDFCHWGEYV